MKTHVRSIKKKSLFLLNIPWLALLLLLVMANGVSADPQDIDLNCLPAPAAYTINAVVGQAFNVDINAIDAVGDTVTWIFDSEPPVPPCTGGGSSFTCYGITITLPTAAPGSKVAVAGTPTATGSFNFILEPSTTTKNCPREYNVSITQPFDIVFVLDRSGSMNWKVDLSNPASAKRWDALHKAVVDSATLTGFVSEFVDAGSDDGSNFGMTLFATKVLTPTDPDPDFQLHDSDFLNLVDINASLANKVNTELNSQTPKGWTAMGSGLQSGEAMMADCNRPRVIVLFSDGEQNQDPMVASTGTNYENPTSDINVQCPGPGQQKVEIVSVGIMNSASGSYYTTLLNLAQQNGGNKALITSTGTSFDVSGGPTGVTLEAAFNAAIVDALAGNSPQIITSYRGSLTDPVTTLPGFSVNRKVKQLMIKLSLSRKFEIPELMALFAGSTVMQNSNNITHYFQPVFVGNYTDTLWLRSTFTLPADTSNPNPASISPEGEYSLTLTKPSSIQDELGFNLTVFVDDHHLDMDWSVNPATPKVDNPFTPTVQLSWQGQPVTNAAIEALILKPGDDLGDMLAKHPQRVDPASSPDAGSPGDQKFKYLLENDPDFLQKLLPNEQQLTLSHQAEGRYTATFSPGDVSGVYQIIYRVSAEDTNFGKIQRSTIQSVYTRFGDVDLETSEISNTTTDNGVTINLRPKAGNGRLIGPSQASAFKIDGMAVSKITDHQDGYYTIVLTGDPNAQISVKLLDEEIYQGIASDFGPDTPPFAWPLWLIILLILVALLLLWIIVRAFRGGSNP